MFYPISFLPLYFATLALSPGIHAFDVCLSTHLFFILSLQETSGRNFVEDASNQGWT